MARVAVIGAGQAGTLMALGLHNKGHEVALYSDLTADEILDKTPPTGTAYIFGKSVDVERRNGIETFEDVAVPGNGIHLFFSPKIGTELIQVGATLGDATGYAVDVRLKSKQRMDQFEKDGGRLVIEKVTPESLDAIAAQNDLTVVSTGKAALAELFERDIERSVYKEPQRYLGMVIVTGIATDGTAFPHRLPGHTPVCFNFFGDSGEFFFVPYYHKTAGSSWNLVFEARPGGAFDIYREVSSGEEMLEKAKAIIREYAPWDWGTMKDMELVSDDDHPWLRGQFPPTVRKPLGRTESGRPVMALGDTAYAFDPVGGQGAGCGVRQAGHYIDAIESRGDQPFDESWITETAESFYTAHGKPTYDFNNVLLEPLDKVGVTVMKAAFGSQPVADQFFRNFDEPACYWPWLKDAGAAKEWIAASSGESSGQVVRRGTLRIIKGQLRQRLKGRHFTYTQDAGE